MCDHGTALTHLSVFSFVAHVAGFALGAAFWAAQPPLIGSFDREFAAGVFAVLWATLASTMGFGIFQDTTSSTRLYRETTEENARQRHTARASALANAAPTPSRAARRRGGAAVVVE